MKKIIILLLAFFCASILYAQKMETYNLVSSAKTFTPITDADMVFDKNSDVFRFYDSLSYHIIHSSGTPNVAAVEGYTQWGGNTGGDGIGAAFDMGFDFDYNGEKYSNFIIYSNGGIKLGGDTIQVEQGSSPWNAFKWDNDNTRTNIIAAMYHAKLYTGETTKYSYKIEGSKLTVEFLNLGYNYDQTSGLATDFISYQIILDNTTQNVEFIFGDVDVTNENANFFTVIAKGLGEVDKTIIFPETDDRIWADPQASTTAENLNSKLSNYTLTSGLSYVLDPNIPCVAPDDINVIDSILFDEVTSTNIVGRLINIDAEADKIILLMSEGAFTGTLKNGTDYAIEEMVGNGKVIINQALMPNQNIEFNIFEMNRINRIILKPNVDYHFTAVAYNAKCKGSAYTTTSFSKNIKTMADAPEDLFFTETSDSTMTLNTVANSDNNEVIVLYTTVLGEDANWNEIFTGFFAIPSDTNKVGDDVYTVPVNFWEESEFGGTVLYKGPAGVEFELDGLKIGDIRHFGAFSIGEAGVSTVWAVADTITPLYIPYKPNFDPMAPSTVPYPWTADIPVDNRDESTFILTHKKDCIQSLMVGTKTGVSRFLTSPKFTFNDPEDTRLIITFSVDKKNGSNYTTFKAEDWHAKDSLNFQISENGINFTTVYSITKENIGEKSGQKQYIRLNGTAGKSGYVRIVRTLYSDKDNNEQEISVKITHYELAINPECDYIRSVSVSATADQAKLSFKTDGDETQWDVRYKTELEDNEYSEYSEIVRIGSNPYILADLPPSTYVVAQARAVCGVGSVSDWTSSSRFKTGVTIPLEVPFSDLYFTSWSGASLPSGWNIEEREESLKDLDTLGYTTSSHDFYYEWGTDRLCTYEEPVIVGALGFTPAKDIKSYVLMSPLYNFKNAELPYKIEFDAAYIQKTAAEAAKSTKTAEEPMFAVMVSEENNSKIYKVANRLKTFSAAELLTLGDSTHIVVDMTGFTGMRSIAFYSLGDTTDANILQMNNFKLWQPCAAVDGFKVSHITETSANLNFYKNSLIDNHLIKITAKGGLDTRIIESDTTAIVISDLLEATEYTIGVSYICNEDNDSATWSNVTFTTAGVPCFTPTALTMSTVSTSTAKFTYEGLASALEYRIAIKPETSTDFEYYITTAKEYTFINLLPVTKYNVKVQSVCGESALDTSEYTTIQSFTTLEITCFPPTELELNSTTHTSAEMVWEGDADKYYVAYDKANNYSGYSKFAVVDEKKIVLQLESDTEYKIKVRSICGVDTTAYCDEIKFFTSEIPPCPTPTALNIENITETDADLTWSKDPIHIDFSIRYRMSSVTVWDTVAKNITETSFKLTNLIKNTPYLWTICATCTEDRASGWATQFKFTTAKDVNNEDVKKHNNFVVYTSNEQIHIINNDGINVKHIELISTMGKLINKHQINSTSNISFATNLDNGVVILAIYTDNGVKYIKLFIE